MRLSIAIYLLAGWLLACAAPAKGASFSNVNVQWLGSKDPVGDVVTVRFVARATDRSLRLEVQAAYLQLEKQDAKPEDLTVVKSKDPKFRTAEGTFVVSKVLERDHQNDGIMTASATIPYNAMDLAVGKYRVCYLVSLYESSEADSKERIAFNVPTKFGMLEIFETPRAITLHGVSTRLEQRTVKQQIRLPDVDLAQGFTLLEIQVEEQVSREDIISNKVTSRWQSAAEGELVTVKGDDPRESLIANLRNTQWIPSPSQHVYFATNRNLANPRAKDISRFGNGLDDAVHYGEVTVNIPASVHRQGQPNEQPTFSKWFFPPDPEKYVFAHDVEDFGQDGFARKMKDIIGRQRNDALVVIHGYANSFESVVLTAGRLKYDIEFTGPVIAFSWPSQGVPVSLLSPTGPYRADEGAAAKSVDALVDVLTRLKSARGEMGGRVHILAHSMGNRLLVAALERLGQQPIRAGQKPFGHVVFAAPDIPVRAFVQALASMDKVAEDMTLYFCKDDVALQVSRDINKDSRVGQDTLLVPMLDNIDCTKANTSWLGHGYVVATNVILTDLQMFLQQGKKTTQRMPPLRRIESRPHVWWAFP